MSNNVSNRLRAQEHLETYFDLASIEHQSINHGDSNSNDENMGGGSTFGQGRRVNHGGGRCHDAWSVLSQAK